MINSLRLFYFENTRGNAAALKILTDELGLNTALSLVLKLKWRMFYHSPFKEINREKHLSEQEKLSQKQMGPMLVLYDLLQEYGYSESDTMIVLKTLGDKIATAFLQFNVPVIKKSTYVNMTKTNKISFLEKITHRFFNANATLVLDDKDNFQFNVSHCHFSHYCKVLGYPKLAELFCSADKLFFNEYQEDIVFFRSQTLAENNKPCDFQFTWKP
ncbi:hypothetical protein A9Q99_11390 [Gammaproteobacteria bacterium 45_16_T64]|nr:hypothetical protein A9Q99_11390 [Gammaproteobacteria bacterium 45_16_T64]